MLICTNYLKYYICIEPIAFISMLLLLHLSQCISCCIYLNASSAAFISINLHLSQCISCSIILVHLLLCAVAGTACMYSTYAPHIMHHIMWQSTYCAVCFNWHNIHSGALVGRAEAGLINHGHQSRQAPQHMLP